MTTAHQNESPKPLSSNVLYSVPPTMISPTYTATVAFTELAIQMNPLKRAFIAVAPVRPQVLVTAEYGIRATGREATGRSPLGPGAHVAPARYGTRSWVPLGVDGLHRRIRAAVSREPVTSP